MILEEEEEEEEEETRLSEYDTTMNIVMERLDEHILEISNAYDEWSKCRFILKLDDFILGKLKNMKASVEQEKEILAWAETDDIRLADKRREHVINHVQLAFLEEQLEGRKKHFDPSLPSAWDDRRVIEQIESMLGAVLSKVSAVRDNANTSNLHQEDDAPSHSQHSEQEPEEESSSSSFSSEETEKENSPLPSPKAARQVSDTEALITGICSKINQEVDQSSKPVDPPIHPDGPFIEDFSESSLEPKPQ